MRQYLRLVLGTIGVFTLLSTSTAKGQTPAQVPSSDFSVRRAKVAAALPHAVLVVPSRFEPKAEDQHGFRQNPDFYYLSGLGNAPGMVLLIDGPRQRSILFVGPVPDVFSRWLPKPTSAPNASLGFHRILPWDSFPVYLDRRFTEQPRLPVYLTDTITAETPAGIPPSHDPAALWSSALRQRWPKLALHSARGLLDSLRWIKSPAEIAVLRQVGALSAEALRAALQAVAPGQRQRLVELAVVGKCVTGGGEGPSFWPWTMSGPNAVVSGIFASFVDYHHLDRRMQPGELIRLDVGCDLGHYLGDVGRTAPVSGRFSAGQREVWQLLVAAYRAGLGHIRDGVTSDDVINASLNRLRKLRDGLKTEMGRAAAGQLVKQGGAESWQLHGVGLESAECCARPKILRAGMVLAFEPDILVNGQAFYLEDMVLVREHGSEILTPGLPYTADEIEEVMR